VAEIVEVTAIGVATLFLAAGLWFALGIVKQVETQLEQPIGRTYTLAIARFPDALILQFGYEQRYRDIPASLKINYVNWSLIVDHLTRQFANVIYANRRTAGKAITENPNITIREKTLCVYKGFAICLDAKNATAQNDLESALGSNHDKATEVLKAILSKGKIAVQEDTDQHAALIKLYEQELKLSRDLIKTIKPPEDVLEVAIGASDPVKVQASGEAIIGFVGGITERVIGEKIGFWVAAEQPIILDDHFEINSFVYASPSSPGESKDLFDTLTEVEALWDETIERVLSETEAQERFRIFLNQELRGQLGPKAMQRLGTNDIFSIKDMEALFSRWLHFPSKGPVSLIQKVGAGKKAERRAAWPLAARR
jgi:hypothetical protein